jgi:hypothetical protein
MDDEEIEKKLLERTPNNTRSTKNMCWRIFRRFLVKYGLVFDPKTATDEDMSNIMKKFAFNVRKVDGSDFKDESLKSIWNSVAKQMMDQVFNETGRNVNIFKDPAFKEARDAKFVKRRDLQKDPSKRKVSATPLTADESREIIALWGTDTPVGLNRTLFHLGGFTLANRGGDQSSWRLEDFEKEVDNKGKLTGNFFLFFFNSDLIFQLGVVTWFPVHEKNAQGGDGEMAQPRLLMPSSKLDKSFMDLLELVISKRPAGAKDSRIFLQPNPSWELSGQWFKTQPVGVHSFRNWMKESAEKIGLETSNKRRRITNQSHRSTTVTLAMGAGGADTEVARITGHKDPRSLSSYVDPTEARRGELKDQAFLGIPKKIDLPTGRREITNQEAEHGILPRRFAREENNEGPFHFGRGSTFTSCTIIFQASPQPPQQPPQPPPQPQQPQPPQPPQ